MTELSLKASDFVYIFVSIFKICCSNYYQAALNINFICFILVELQGSQLRDLCIGVDKLLFEGEPCEPSSNNKENQPKPNGRKVDRLSSQC